jgi:SP family arabinose:H+ symporter-like MFS transporter
VVAFGFPYFAETLGGATTFFFFAAMMVLQLIFVWRWMPETKGRSLEQIEDNIILH